MTGPSTQNPFPPVLVSHTLAWPSAVALAPLLFVQGKYVRRVIPRMPQAPEPWSGVAPGPEPIRVLGLGDSTIAGVGVSDAMHGLTAQFSIALGAELSRGVSWRCVGESGATTKDILQRFLPPALEEPADVLLVSIGTNDAKDLKPLRATIARFERLINVLREGHPNAVMLFSSLPAFYLFPTLPEPLRGILYRHAQAIERSVRPLIEARSFAFMSPPPSRYNDTFFAEDGFHPSADGYRGWAHFALRDALERGALAQLTAR